MPKVAKKKWRRLGKLTVSMQEVVDATASQQERYQQLGQHNVNIPELRGRIKEGRL